ncbi:MAG: alkaline phosphatase [Planctomycetia bacterium]|nr:alkaline phosphatase [Planctomycetia bacterium]
MTARPRPTAFALTLLLALPAPTRADDKTADAGDRLKRLQAANIATARQKVERAYHFGSQGPKGVYSNHASHTNRLIPIYTFGRKIDLGSVTGGNSVYRSPEGLEKLYGYRPENTVNPEAEYADQTDLYRVQAEAVDRGIKHLFVVWFDGLDWPTTRAAALAKTGKDYTEGKGSGLVFQDYTAGGSARFGYYVTAPSHDKNQPDLDAQTVTIPAASLRGGYDARIAGPNPWTPGPLADRAPGYLKGQSANDDDKAGVTAAGRVLHAYTDSSTSAASFINGKKGYNNGINATDDGTFVPTLFHRLQREGWKVGTATSVAFDHASPAAMYAHNVHRDDYQDLAREMLGLTSVTQQARKDRPHPGLDVVIGAGYGQEATDRGLQAQGKNARPGNLYLADDDLAAVDVRNGGQYVVAHTEAGVNGGKALNDAAATAAKGGHRLFGFFGAKGALNHLPYRTADGQFDPAPDLDGKADAYTPADLAEQPTLADMTRAALTAITADPGRKFALFIEAGDVDFALHKNNLDNAVGAVHSGEDAVRVVIEWVEAHSNWDDSALVVTADHGHYLVLDDPAAIAGGK